MNTKPDFITVALEPHAATELLYGMQQLCDGMNDGVFGWNVSHVMSKNEKLTATENAYDFVAENYNTIAGAFRIMAAATSVICTCLSNGDLELVPGKGAASND